MPRFFSLCFLAATVSATACSHSVLVKRPSDPVVDHALTEMWTQEIQRVAQDGDWLLVRSYASVGDAIVVLTSGEEITHAAMYDANAFRCSNATSGAVSRSSRVRL